MRRTNPVRKGAGRKLIALLLFLCSVACTTACTSKKRQIQNAVVVQVDDYKLTTKQFADRLALKLKQFDALAVKDSSTLTRVKEEVIKNFIIESITEEWANKNNVSVSKDELDKEVTSIRANYPDDLTFRRALAAENLPFQEWQRNFQKTLLQRKVSKKMVDDLPHPSEADLKKYYDENKSDFEVPERIRLTQIVVSQENDAKHLYDEVKKTGKIAELAKKYSIAPEASQGGDTGWIEKGTLPVFDRAFSMSIGTLAPIMKSPYGFHIYKVVAKQPGGHLSFDQAHDMILRRLLASREQSIFTAWLESQLKVAKIKRNEFLINSLNVETRGN